MRPWHAFYPEGVAPSAAYPDLMVWELLERAARRTPGKAALVDGDVSLNYAQLWRRALGIAGGLDIDPGDRVVLRMRNSAALVACWFGVTRAGGIAVPASPDAEPPVEDAGARLVLEAEPEPRPPREPVRNPIAALLYTSGTTTGRGKGVILTHENLVANAYQNARWFGWTSREVNLAVLPLYHVWGLSTCMNSTVAVGGTLVVVDRFEPRTVLETVARHGATVLYGSATMFYRLLDAEPRAIPTLRHSKAGAMLTQGDLKALWDARYPHAPLQQGYGLTEASPECHNNPPAAFRAGTVGIPVQDTDCRIGEEGEVQIRGPQVTPGYWNRPDETAAAFAGEGWLKTGDVGELDADGYLRIVDRIKDMLKVRGWTVSPNRVESCLLAHPAVKEVIVVGRPEVRDGDVPTAFLVLAGDDATDEELAGHCRARLASYEVPREFRRVEAIPKNQVGKPLRRVLRDTLS